jgi:hypothetical protein
LTPPRLFGIPARRAPIVAVLRRGPSNWSHVGRWDLARGVYEPGAWIRANLYPQRADLSPDGRWLCYFTLKGPGAWPPGWTFVAVSKLPWVTALAAWGTCGTWTRGAHFVDDRRVQELGPPDAGDAQPLTRRYGLALNRPVTFAVERRRGWTDTPETPPRADDDLWDERRADDVVVHKVQPGSDGARVLTARGAFAAFREGPFRGRPRVTDYALVERGTTVALTDVQWAEWDTDGRLLVATIDGRLQVRKLDRTGFTLLHETDLALLEPTPTAPPHDARVW